MASIPDHPGTCLILDKRLIPKGENTKYSSIPLIGKLINKLILWDDPTILLVISRDTGGSLMAKKPVDSSIA